MYESLLFNGDLRLASRAVCVFYAHPGSGTREEACSEIAFNFFSFEKFQHDSSENTVYVGPLGRQL